MGKRKDYEKLLQIDGDPIEDRRTSDGRWRPLLNQREVRELTDRQMLAKIVDRFVEKTDPPQIAKELGVGLDIVSSALTNEDEQVRDLFLDRILDKIFDLENVRSRSELAEEMGITPVKLRNLMRSERFKELYRIRFSEVRSDINIPVVQQAVVQDLLPAAFRALQEALVSRDAPWTVRQKAYQDVFRMAGIGAVEPVESDKAEAANFLKQMNIQINVNSGGNVLPPEYEEAVRAYLPDPETIEGVATEVEDEAQAPSMSSQHLTSSEA